MVKQKKFKKRTSHKKQTEAQKRKIIIATFAWGVITLILGFMFYYYAVLPMAYQASTDTVFSGKGTQAGVEIVGQGLKDTGVSTEENVLLVILGWINFSLPFSGLLAFAGIVYAGFLYVANFGNDEMTGKAKKIIFWAIAGLVLIFSAYAIVATVIRASTTTI